MKEVWIIPRSDIFKTYTKLTTVGLFHSLRKKIKYQNNVLKKTNSTHKQMFFIHDLGRYWEYFKVKVVQTPLNDMRFTNVCIQHLSYLQELPTSCSHIPTVGYNFLISCFICVRLLLRPTFMLNFFIKFWNLSIFQTFKSIICNCLWLWQFIFFNNRLL